MYNRQVSVTADASRLPQSAPTDRVGRAAETERGANDQIRELLRCYGLRTSLIRLKVIDVLLVAARKGRAIGVRGVHAQLEELEVALSFLSVREVLKRLCSEGVISLGPDKCYSLTPQARSLLEHGAGD